MVSSVSASDNEKQVLLNIEREAPFDFLTDVDLEKMVSFISNENDSVGAFIMNQLSEERLNAVTYQLDKEKLKSIIDKLIFLHDSHGEFIHEIETEIQRKIASKKVSTSEEESIKIRKASSIFETLPDTIRLSIFNDIQNENPELLNKIKSQMFTFNDIELMDDVDIQSLIFDLKDMPIIATALHQSSPSLIQRFTNNFSERFSIQFESAKNEISAQIIGSDEIISAQNTIIRTLRKLEKIERIHRLNDIKRRAIQ